MKKIARIIRLIGYTLALLIIAVLLLELYLFSIDLSPTNFSVTIANVKCLAEKEQTEVNIRVSYNGTYPLNDFRALLEIKKGEEKFTIKSKAINLVHGSVTILTIPVSSEDLRIIEEMLLENATLFLGFEFKYNKILPLKIAYTFDYKLFIPQIEPYELKYYTNNSQYNVILYVIVVNPLPHSLGVKAVLTINNVSKFTNLKLKACESKVLKMPTITLSKEIIKMGANCTLKLLMNNSIIDMSSFECRILGG